MATFVKYTHIKASIQTVSGLVEQPSFKGNGVSVGKFVATTDASGVSNLERIYERYTSVDFDNDISFRSRMDADVVKMKLISKKQLDSFIPISDILKGGTELIINLEDIHNNLAIPEASSERAIDYTPFIENALLNLMVDSGYKDRESYDSDSGLYDKNPKATVWLWCRSLGEGGYLDGKLVDLTPFIVNINTSKQKLDSSFNLTLAYAYSKFKEIIGGDVFDAVMNSVDSQGKRRRNQSQFHKLVAKNDIIFIRMSQLEMEPDNDGVMRQSISPYSIVGKVFDMMGLVDCVRDGFGSGGDNVTVNISGSDFTKLLSEDGSSVYQVQYVSAGQTRDEIEVSGDIFRLFGKHSSMFALQDQPIGRQLQFVIDYMSRSKICEGLFTANPKARSRRMDIGEGNSIVSSEVQGLWKIFNVGVDKEIANYTSFNSRLGNDYSPLIAQLGQICQEPFVELFTDTYKDTFHIMARRPPFDRNSVTYWASSEYLKTIHESNVINDSLDYDNRSFSWYKIDIRFLSAAFEADFKWLFPAKYFQEYADIFGDKPLQVDNPYISHEMAESNTAASNLLGRKMMEAGVKDFKYLIETHMYLPFTRTGTITVNGDRTYKRGIWIYHEGTNEIMYVDAVSHNMGISSAVDWTTTLSVSRAMVLEDIDKYFSLINMPISSLSPSDNLIKFLEGTLKRWNVNMESFNYFVKRKQYKHIVETFDIIQRR